MDSLLTCTLCNSSYALVDKTPKILSCGETFCSSCLSTIQYEGVITCVDCGVQTILPNEGVNGLPTNNNSKKMALKLAKQKEEESSFQCASHPSEKLRLFCSSPLCMKPVCILCVTEEHKTHDFKVIENAFEYYRKSVLLQVETVKGILIQTNKEIENVTNRLSSLENEKQTATQNVKDSFNKIREWITKRETELLESINTSTQAIFSGLLSSQQSLHTLSSTTQQSIHEIESHLEKIINSNNNNINNNNSNSSDTLNQLEFLKNTKKYTNNLDSSISTLQQQINNNNNNNQSFKPHSITLDEFDEHTIQSFISKIGNIVVKGKVGDNSEENKVESKKNTTNRFNVTPSNSTRPAFSFTFTPTQSTFSSSVFGAPSALGKRDSTPTPTQSVFGAPSVFGKKDSTPTPTKSVFGSSSVFGTKDSTPTPTQSVFGSSIFGAPSMFGTKETDSSKKPEQPTSTTTPSKFVFGSMGAPSPAKIELKEADNNAKSKESDEENEGEEDEDN